MIIETKLSEANIQLELHGKRALVGGASQGIGAAIAKRLAECGAQVILAARSEEKLRKVMSELPGTGHEVLAIDFSDLSSLESKIVKVCAKNGTSNGIDILVLNAGGPKSGPGLEAKIEDFELAIRSHLLAFHRLAQLVVPSMKTKKFGRIVTITSTSVKSPIANLMISNSVRASVANWVKTLANELGGYGITVNNVLPGYIDTDRLGELAAAQAKRAGKELSDIQKTWVQSIPAGRLGQPEEIAAAVAFLASTQASYINGINLPVDGGRLGTL